MNDFVFNELSDQARDALALSLEEMTFSSQDSGILFWVYNELHHESYFRHWGIKAKAAGMVRE